MLVAAAALTALIVFLTGQGNDSASKQRARDAAKVAAERRRLSHEQAPHHGRATGVPLPVSTASARDRRDARRRLVASRAATRSTTDNAPATRTTSVDRSAATRAWR